MIDMRSELHRALGGEGDLTFHWKLLKNGGKSLNLIFSYPGKNLNYQGRSF